MRCLHLVPHLVGWEGRPSAPRPSLLRGGGRPAAVTSRPSEPPAAGSWGRGSIGGRGEGAVWLHGQLSAKLDAVAPPKSEGANALPAGYSRTLMQEDASSFRCCKEVWLLLLLRGEGWFVAAWLSFPHSHSGTALLL